MTDMATPENVVYREEAKESEITPQSLWEDNHSDEANKRREQFEKAKANNDITLVYRCSDSRLLICYQNIMANPAIAAAGSRTPFVNASSESYVKNLSMITHDPCGGQSAKESQERHGVPKDEDIHEFVEQYVLSSDPVEQAIRSARRISTFTDKPVLAAVHTQEDGQIKPYAVYQNGKVLLGQNVEQDKFGDFLIRNETYVKMLKGKYPDLTTTQKVQNPGLVAIFENMRPFDILYPNTSDKPGSVFRIRIPRANDHLEPNHVSLVVRQAHYPIANFDKAKRVLIETKKMEDSKLIASHLARRPWMRQWLQQPDHQVFVAQADDGLLQQEIEVFKKAA